MNRLLYRLMKPISSSSLKSKKGGKNGILIDGEDGLMTTLAKCCKPAPPDDIIGFVTRDRGISVHRNTCPSFRHLAEQSPEKVLNASWAALQEGQVFAVDVESTPKTAPVCCAMFRMRWRVINSTLPRCKPNRVIWKPVCALPLKSAKSTTCRAY